jgi:uncharacterized protein
MLIERAHTVLAMVDFPGGFDSRRVRPYITPESRAHYDGLTEGLLLLPECMSCATVSLATNSCCARCGSLERRWRQCSGRGVIHSWVRYHRAYLPEFEALVPYEVIAVRLEEGPVMFGRWLARKSEPLIDAPVRGVVERWGDGFCGLAFDEAAP